MFLLIKLFLLSLLALLPSLLVTLFHGLFNLLPVIGCLGHLFLVAVDLVFTIFTLLVFRHYIYYMTLAGQHNFNLLITFIILRSSLEWDSQTSSTG
jgi:hypothetical protein